MELIRDGRNIAVTITSEDHFQRCLDRLRGMHSSRYDPRKKRWNYPDTPVGHWEFYVTFCKDQRARDFSMLDGNDIEFAIEKRLQLVGAENVRESVDLGDDEGEVLPSWSHQKQGSRFASHLSGCMLNMQMGCGKTKVAIDTIERSKEVVRGLELNSSVTGRSSGFNGRDDLAKILILCPVSVQAVWDKQIEMHSRGHLEWEVLKGSVQAKQQTAANNVGTESGAYKGKGRSGPYDKGGRVQILNYESAWREPFASWALAQTWDWVVLDEIHKIKGASGKASRFCWKLSRVAKNRLGLTGTVFPHSPLDAFGQYRFIDPAIFGEYSFAKFRDRYAQMGGFQSKQVVGFRNQEAMAKRMELVTFSCRTDEVLDLPPEMDIVRNVELSYDEEQAYNEMQDEMMVQLSDGVLTASNGLAKLLRLQQITSGYLPSLDSVSSGATNRRVEILGTTKKDALKGILEETGEEPVVVFCRFTADLESVKQVCEELSVPYGEISGGAKDIEAKWNAEDGYRVLGVQLQSGGLGIDLTYARYAVYLSMGFSLGDYEQSRARIRRPGQDRKCIYIQLVANGTIDETVYSSLATKKNVIETVLSDMEHFSSGSQQADDPKD